MIFSSRLNISMAHILLEYLILELASEISVAEID